MYEAINLKSEDLVDNGPWQQDLLPEFELQSLHDRWGEPWEPSPDLHSYAWQAHMDTPIYTE